MHDESVKDREPICVIGLGKVGLGFAACLARSGFDVLGLDTDVALVGRINAGTAVSDEPGVDEVLRHTCAGRLRASHSSADAAGHADMAFLLLPTPSRLDGSLDTAPLAGALTGLCDSLRASRRERYTIVIGSTVSPGSMTGVLIPAMARAFDGSIGKGVAICYNPELIALGSVVADFERPDLIIIGADDRAAGLAVERVHRKLLRNVPVIHHMSLIDAEITKIALNNYLTIKISFANFLSQMCAGIPGASVDAITTALGSDGRIGARFLRAGLAFGGPCFPRDTAALAAWAAEHDHTAPLVDAVVAVNRAQHDLLLSTVRGAMARAGARAVALLGLAYKPSTPHVLGSPSMALIEALHADGVRIIAYDTRALGGAAALDGRFEPAEDVTACVGAAPVVVLMHAESSYIAAIHAYRGAEAKTVVDCWRSLGPAVSNPHLTVIGLGQAITQA
ncbi:MAG: nucleotide sugar dehydrogenase [Acidobacteriota bacterium]